MDSELIYQPDIPSKCKWAVDSDIQSPHTTQLMDRSRPKIYPDILQSVGNTCMVRLNKIPQSMGVECEILAKCEYFNPSGTNKDRIVLRMVEDAEKAGKITPGVTTLIEASSGNTGLGIALVGAVKGYNCIIVMPEKMSDEKICVLQALGAKTIRTKTEAKLESPESYFQVAQKLLKEVPNSYMLNQFRNPSNPLAHYDITAEEILDSCDGKLDMIVLCTGTGGNISGIGRKLREKCKSCKIIGVDPEGSILAQPDELNVNAGKFFELEGIGIDFVPTTLDRTLVDKWYKANDKVSMNMARRIIKEEGLLCEGTGGAALSCAIKAIKEAGLGAGDRCVIFLSDGIRNYMTKFISDEWMIERDFLEVPDLSEKNPWWNRKISDLKKVHTWKISPTKLVKDALKEMKLKGCSQIPVVENDGKLLGTLTLDSLLARILSSNDDKTQQVGSFDPKGPVSSYLTGKFPKVSIGTTLGKLGFILNRNHFAIIIKTENEVEKFVGMVTQIDLLDYIVNVK